MTSAAVATVEHAPVPLTHCRICGNHDLLPILSLGDQELTGVFPRTRDQPITKGPLELVWCHCGLLQLGHTYPADEMYGQNYGYRSGLNQSMVDHLTLKAHKLAAAATLCPGDVVLDIGSNDATLLKAFPNTTRRIGVDPTGLKFHSYYPDDIYLIPEFFTGDSVGPAVDGARPRLITSIAMFYDLQDPAQFAQDIERTLADDGIWHLEMGYMPAMLRNTAYDAICHEHLEFYSFTVIKHLLEANGMKVLDVELNDVNGGSFAVTAAKQGAPYTSNSSVRRLLWNEQALGLDSPVPFRDFERRVSYHRTQLLNLLQKLADTGKTVVGYGASTKGNVMLQYCGITEHLLPAIAEVNEDKFGCFTPGTGIPIISETEAAAMRPDYYLVFPWHFKQGILKREQEFRDRGGKLIFPLPQIEIV